MASLPMFNFTVMCNCMHLCNIFPTCNDMHLFPMLVVKQVPFHPYINPVILFYLFMKRVYAEKIHN